VSGRGRAASGLRDLAEVLLVAVLLATWARTFVAQAYRIPTASMEPALVVGDHVLVNRFVFAPRRWQWEQRWLPQRDPRDGDVAVFRYPRDPRRPYVKRVLATPGERVEVIRRQLRRGDRPIDEVAYVRHTDPNSYPSSLLVDLFYRRRDNFGPATVPEDAFFVLGDNRESSTDSRFWGFVPRHYLLGRVVAVYWSAGPGRGRDVHLVQ
jgi:signal peptidase I